ncbi:MAG: hypothetical protein ABF303_18025, partial [Desulfobacterales bacterium]
VYKAHPAAHIEIRVGGCNAVDDPKDKQDVELFFAGALKAIGIRNLMLETTLKAKSIKWVRNTKF